MSAAGLERPRQPRSLPRYIKRDLEIARVLAAAASPDPHGRRAWPQRDIAVAALLVAGPGIRAGELCGLRARDLVLEVEDTYVWSPAGVALSAPAPRPRAHRHPSAPTWRIAASTSVTRRGATSPCG